MIGDQRARRCQKKQSPKKKGIVVPRFRQTLSAGASTDSQPLLSSSLYYQKEKLRCHFPRFLYRYSVGCILDSTHKIHLREICKVEGYRDISGHPHSWVVLADGLHVPSSRTSLGDVGWHQWQWQNAVPQFLDCRWWCGFKVKHSPVASACCTSSLSDD